MKVPMATMLKVFIGGMGVVTLFVAMTQAFVAQKEQSPFVKAEPRTLALEVGAIGKFDCHGEMRYKHRIQWLYSDGTTIPTTGASIVTNHNGTLLITTAKLEDSDDYICTTKDLAHRVNVTLKVYKMPSYRTEGIVMVVINGLLLSIFLACMVVSKMKEHKMRRKYRALSSNAGMEPLASASREPLSRATPYESQESNLADEAIGGEPENTSNKSPPVD